MNKIQGAIISTAVDYLTFYIKNERTGKYERAGFGDTGFLVQVNARIRYDGEEAEFVLKIEDCRHNPYLSGEELSGPMCDFEMLKSMVLE